MEDSRQDISGLELSLHLKQLLQPGEAVAAEVVVSNDAERAISVSRVKACCGGEAEMVPMAVPAKGEAKLTLRMKAQIPGEIAKAVTL